MDEETLTPRLTDDYIKELDDFEEVLPRLILIHSESKKGCPFCDLHNDVEYRGDNFELPAKVHHAASKVKPTRHTVRMDLYLDAIAKMTDNSHCDWFKLDPSLERLAMERARTRFFPAVQDRKTVVGGMRKLRDFLIWTGR